MRVPAWQVAEPTTSPRLERERLVLVRGELLPTVDVRDLYAGFALVDRLTPVELPACTCAPYSRCHKNDPRPDDAPHGVCRNDTGYRERTP